MTQPPKLIGAVERALDILEKKSAGQTISEKSVRLSVVKHISDRVAVMYVGRIVEMAAAQDIFYSPLHPYTEALLSAVPKPDPRLRSQRIVLQGSVADPANPPPGCYFHPRCRYAVEECHQRVPELQELRAGHFVACHRAAELNLQGVVA
jgi:peptide/nickel transport system ATP-binding protein